MTRTEAERLWNEWTRMWNDDPAIAERIVGPRFHLHLSVPGTDPRTVDSPARVRDWVRGFRARYERLVFATGWGPTFDEALGTVSGPWMALSRVKGRDRISNGIDILRIHDGKIVEYWTLSNQVDAIGTWNTLLSA